MHNIRQLIYGLLAIAGLIATWYHNLQFMDGGYSFDLMTFIQDAYTNHASSSLTNDLVVACLAGLVLIFAESRRLQMRHSWIYLPLTFSVAFAFALPLFLLMRERHLHREGLV